MPVSRNITSRRILCMFLVLRMDLHQYNQDIPIDVQLPVPATIKEFAY
jgi:hypothetical protein